ncbi:hypothetical protein DFJ43DRAFT_1151484 [Lentinula guzmanii]|uniref:Uncharacterized protein n=1 Tax=Lentinula guzmanii TaxID=2804957 RepID=A0AA38JRM5_9AGAR|nr:hypothetical protein DFJ43DRAFT_1151484 [Lentinula guzmanii]
MPSKSTPETVITSIPSPETVVISTFASPRPAPPPIVVPLFASTVQLRRHAVLALHETLDSKPRSYHPYPQTKRPVPSNVPAPGSPLTPITPEQPVGAGVRQTEPRLILVPPPHGTLTVPKLGLAEAVARDYRLIAKKVILDLTMDIHQSLTDQDSQSKNAARARIEHEIPHLKLHEDHWGADILLRDQLKSMKDVANKVSRRERRKNNEASDNDRRSNPYLPSKNTSPICLRLPVRSFPTLVPNTRSPSFYINSKMPRTSYTVCKTSKLTLLSIRAYFISTLDHRGTFIPLPTTAPNSKHDSLRRPHVDYWLPPVSQAYVHRVIAHFHGERFAIYFQRYHTLPENTSLNFRGNLVITRMGSKNPLNPVNMKAGKCSDARKARAIVKK